MLLIRFAKANSGITCGRTRSFIDANLEIARRHFLPVAAKFADARYQMEMATLSPST